MSSKKDLEKNPWKGTLNLDALIHSPIRFSIMLFLLPRGQVKYREIQKALDVTAGNLTTHLKKLTSAEFIEIEKLFIDEKPEYYCFSNEGNRILQKIFGKLIYITYGFTSFM